MDLKLNDKVVLVTGAGAAEARAMGVKTIVVGADLRSGDAVADAVGRVESELGAIDVLATV